MVNIDKSNLEIIYHNIIRLIKLISLLLITVLLLLIIVMHIIKYIYIVDTWSPNLISKDLQGAKIIILHRDKSTESYKSIYNKDKDSRNELIYYNFRFYRRNIRGANKLLEQSKFNINTEEDIYNIISDILYLTYSNRIYNRKYRYYPNIKMIKNKVDLFDVNNELSLCGQFDLHKSCFSNMRRSNITESKQKYSGFITILFDENVLEYPFEYKKSNKVLYIDKPIIICKTYNVIQ